MSIFGKIVSAITGLLRGRDLTREEVENHLAAAAAMRDEKLDWQHSIVDLLKLLEMDSSLGARRDLADELGYEGNPNNTAAMNQWLHDEVMQQLSERYLAVPGQTNAR